MASRGRTMIGEGREPTMSRLLEECAQLRREVAELEEGEARHVETEATLRQSLERFRKLTEHTRDVIYRMSLPDGTYEYVSPSSVDLTGYSPEEMYDDPHLIERILHPDFSRFFRERRKSLMEGEIPSFYEYKIIHKSGEERWLQQTNVLVRNESGRPVALEGVVTDISERKKAEETLRASEQRFRSLVETTSDWVWEIDRDGYYSYASPKVKELLGYEPGEIVGKTPFDFMPRDEARRVRVLFKDIIESRKPFAALENVNIRKHGRKVVLESAGVPVFDSRGGFAGYRGIDRDITQRRRAEQALRESEDKFRSLVERSNVGVFMIQDWIIVYSNSRFAEMLGYSPEEMIGRITPEDIVLSEDYRDFAKENIRQRLAGETESIRYEVRLVTRTGEIRNAEAYGSRTVYQGKPAVIGTVLDVTEARRAEAALKESEGKYRSIFENSPLGIFQSTLDGRFIQVNPALARILGYPSADEVIESVRDIGSQVYVEPERRDEVIAKMFEAGDQIAFEGEYFRKDGTRWMGHLTLTVIRNEDGSPHHLDGIVEDVTEKKKMEEQLQKTMKHLRSLSHRLLDVQETERRHLARELHDEIGQTLTALRISLKRVERAGSAEKAASGLRDSVNMVEGLIKQVRNLSIELRPSILDDFGLVAALDWYIKWLAPRMGLTAAFHSEFTEERLSALLELTCFRIVQEALTNVVRHSGAKNVRVELKSLNGELHLSIKDDGKGFNVEKTRKGALRGRTFGLVGMLERTSLAGGRLELESEPGEGTEIHAYFPLGSSPEPQVQNSDTRP